MAVIIILYAAHAHAQGITIQPGASIVTSGNVNIVIDNGGLINNSTASNLQGTDIYFTGSNDDTLGGTFKTIFNNIYVNKKSATLFLNNDVSINGKITMQKGNIDLNKNNIQLASSAVVKGETEKTRIFGKKGGEVRISLALLSPSSKNPGNLGLEITSSSDLGIVSIARGNKPQTNNGSGNSILRYYKITPTNNTSLSATIRVNYFDKELNGIDESDLNIWENTDKGNNWTNKTFSTRDATANYVEQTGFNSLYMYTLSSSGFTLDKSTQNVIASTQKQPATELKNVIMQVLPNPVSNSRGKLLVQSGYAASAEIKISSSTGKLVTHFTAALKPGRNEFSFNAASLISGAYFITLETRDGVKNTVQFIKQ